MQRTISQVINFTGIGLHSGKNIDVTLKPHNTNGGIVFRRIDLTPIIDIPAKATLITDTQLCSYLTVAGAHQNYSVGTVEHIMCAFALLGIDNIVVELNADEIPIMDGSATPFIEMIKKAGIVEQNKARKYIKILEPISIQVDDKHLTLTPYNGFKVNFEIDFNHPAIKTTKQFLQYDLFGADYLAIANARTFGFLKDIEFLRQNNLALGGGLDNAIVLDDEKIVNAEGLRSDDEFVRHKILDSIGDLYLAGHQILGELNAFKSGHELNNLLVRKVLRHPEKYEIVTQDMFAPNTFQNNVVPNVVAQNNVTKEHDHNVLPVAEAS